MPRSTVGAGAAAAGEPHILSGGYWGSSIDPNQTEYFGLGGITIANSTEVLTNIPIAKAGTLQNFRVWVGTNTLDIATVFTVRINGVDTGITLTFAATGIGEQTDLVNTAAIVAGDDLTVSVVTAAGTGIMDGINYSIELAD